ncbi:hypothetical protein [Dactylosporangium darangshiense]|uniref:hypothetical protein n=1 Tax=Dactylosporangium darangshiense TaxID=579108 RepID=UPI0031E51B73
MTFSEFRDYARLDGMEEELHRVVGLLRALGGAELQWEAPAQDRTLSAVIERLDGWADPGRPRSSVLLWMGHGESDGNKAWLAAYDSRRGRSGTAVNLNTLADAIGEEWRRRLHSDTWSLVVVEACRAEAVAAGLTALLAGQRPLPRRLAVIGVGGDGPTYLGELHAALSSTIGAYTVNDETIDLEDLVTELKKKLPGGAVWSFWLHEAPPLARPGLPAGPVTAPVDVYHDLMAFIGRLQADLRAHFVPSAQGGAEGERSWFFTGRRRDRRRIATWLRTATEGMAIVTGPPGSGKSALLGNLVAYADPVLRELLIGAGQLEHLPESERPPDGVFDAVIHLTGLDVRDVLSRLAAAAGLAEPSADADIGERVESLLGRLRDRDAPLTVLVDAVDEAVLPLTVAGSLLRRLAGLPRTRVVAGTRSSTNERLDGPVPADQNVLDALGGAEHCKVFRVEREPGALADYVVRRLTAARAEGTFAADDATIDDLAEQIANRPGQEFLYARLAVHKILNPEDGYPGAPGDGR